MEAAVIRGATPSWLIGSGDGDGDGDGYGYGSGDGSGYGSGDGYGYGSGYGYGYGSGYGYGYGSGYGSGDGYGDGDGYGSYWSATIKWFASKWGDAQRARLQELQKAGAKLAFWKSNVDGTPANGGRCAAVKAGSVHEEPGPLRDDCGAGQLHATLLPASKWHGERWWIVALIGEWRGDDEKMWALKREVIGECLP